MSPPPQTPTPRRFVFPKRQPASTARTNRFASTPRFNPPSSIARPGTQLRDAGIEDVEEEEERVEMSPVGQADEEGTSDEGSEGVGRGRGRDVVGDAIEGFSQEGVVDETRAWESSSRGDQEAEQGQMDVDDEDTSPEKRDSKRRKISITPLPAFSSPIPNRTADTHIHEDQPIDSSSDHSAPSPPSSPLQADSSPSRPQHAQPTFHTAPRFKPLEDETPTEGLPAAFLSPQRRGPKYILGGLAAELQGWLSDVKKGDGSQDTGGLMEVEVAEVRSGRRMYLVRGKAGGRVVLAGEGRLTGLGRRAVVGVGSWVVLGSPVWDVNIGEETWTVACDWSVK